MAYYLLSGATGLVGRYLLAGLLDAGMQVAAIVRPRKHESAVDRMESVMGHWEQRHGRPLPRPVVLVGDLCQPRLGLSDADFAWVAGHCGAVVHAAASMKFREDKQGEPFRSNIDGTRNILELCRDASLRAFHYVSTAFVCGLRQGRVLETELDLGQELGNVYEKSKLEAEKLVRAAAYLDSVTIYRPTSVIGDSRTGYVTNYHGFYLPLQLAHAICGMIPPRQMGDRFFARLGLDGSEGKNFVPIDWLASAIVHLVLQRDYHGATYHLANPQPVRVSLIQAVVQEAIERYASRRLVADVEAGELDAYEALFHEYMSIYRSHWRDDPTFDMTFARPALSHLPCPEVDHEMLLRVARYAIENNFSQPRFQASGGVAAARGSRDNRSSGGRRDLPEAPGPVVGGPIEGPDGDQSLEDPSLSADIPIAIIGMGCRLPGADNLEQFWELLLAGRCMVGELPPDRLDVDLYYDPRQGVRGKTYSKLGAIVSHRDVDWRVCPLSDELVGSVDVVHRVMCDTAAAAFRHARLDPFNLPLRNVGVYIGHAQGSRLGGDLTYGTCIEEAAQFLREVEGFAALPPGQQDEVIRELVDRVRRAQPTPAANNRDVRCNMAAGVISKAFGLTGPYLAINSACASSLQALLLAARALQLGRVDMAVAGGASDCKSDTLILFSHARSMSATGSRPFDSSADGLIVGEGYVALVLKTLERALADGDPIQAVVRGLGVSSDGKGKSLWAPLKRGQLKAMERAYRGSVELAGLQYIEAHATATQLGDATELNTLTEILSRHLPPGKKIPVTSVKANIGHTLETAGIAGVIKAVLCMQHGMIAPAVNLSERNPKIDWDRAPIYIPTTPTPWPAPADGSPRRAGVNAFGIGGLNMHVVLDDFNAQTHRLVDAGARSSASRGRRGADDEAIAVIGLGCILPGAQNPAAYWDLLVSGRNPKCDVPADRWRADLAYEPGSRGPFRSCATRGGFITDFTYDWRAHKLPPKQIAQADPLQFMLLDAASQALHDAGYDQRPFDRSAVSVVVGTEFGGDFAFRLQMGLRLPSLQRLITQLLCSRHVAAERAESIAAQYAERLISHWPSLIDETGSYSTSTLASRISKTWDLAGGAAAIDAGSASALSAVAVSIDMLLSGDCDMVICAAGQRRMGLPTYERLSMAGLLASEDPPRSVFDASYDGFLPGEGVGAVLLKRLSDARRDGDRIRAVIRGVGAGHGTSSGTALQLAIDRSLQIARLAPQDLAVMEYGGGSAPEINAVQLAAIAAVHSRAPRREPLLLSSVTGQIGHADGASGMASLIKAVLEVEQGQVPATVGFDTPAPVLAAQAGLLQPVARPTAIGALTPTGRRAAGVCGCSRALAYHLVLEQGEPVPVSAPAFSAAGASVPAADLAEGRICRLGAASYDQLCRRLDSALADPRADYEEARRRVFQPQDTIRLATVAESPETLRHKWSVARQQVGNAASQTVLDRQGIFCRTLPHTPPRIVLVFAGQGSQYPGMLRQLIAEDPAAADALRAADDIWSRHWNGSFAALAWADPSLLGTDVWATQASVLLADYIVHAAVKGRGIDGALVLGHSFGEYAALTAAGAWDLDTALMVTRARCDGIAAYAADRGGLMATTAEPELIEQMRMRITEPLFVANHNAPDQTVVGGSSAGLEQLAALLQAASHRTRLLPVPCPFHTPLMRDAAAPLEKALQSVEIRAPALPMVSIVTNRLVHTPAEIRANLVAHLTAPVRYVELIRSLAAQSPTVFVEIGPGQVLTHLHERILDGRDAAWIPTDHKSRPGRQQIDNVQALLECVGAFDPNRTPAAPGTRFSTEHTETPEIMSAVRHPILRFDATVRRRERMRRSAMSAAARDRLEPPTTKDIPATSASADPTRSAIAERPGSPKVSSSPPAAALGGTPLSAAPLPAAAVPARQAPPAPTQQPVNAVAMVPAPAPAIELERFLINFVVEQTGYPPEVVELDADLEADLGIDSIKKAQLFGELQEYFDVTPTDNLTLDDFPTLRHVLDFLAAVPAGQGLRGGAVLDVTAPLPTAAATAAASAAAAPAPARPTFAREPVPVAPMAAAASPGLPPSELEKFLVNFVVEQTGYPPEVVELDADLEADLGIDSIKKAQLFGELQEYFDVTPTDNLTLDDFPTLRHVVDFLSDAEGSVHYWRVEHGAVTAASHWSSQELAADLLAAPSPSAAVPPPGAGARYDLDDTREQFAQRFVMRTVPAPWPVEARASGPPYGPALVVGDNPEADALRARLAAAGASVGTLAVTGDLDRDLRSFDELFRRQPIYHLFLTTARDADAMCVRSHADWVRRYQRGVLWPYFLCQRWVTLAGEAGLLDKITAVALTNLGGDVGFSGRVAAPEGGALTGLMKAMYFEIAILRSHPGFRAKAIDAPPEAPPDVLADQVVRELVANTVDYELAFVGGERFLQRAEPAAATPRPVADIRYGATWVVTGGARGITAECVFELGKRFGLDLHLVGTSPLPSIDPTWRSLSDQQMKALRSETLASARQAGQSPPEAWERIEKAIEIDRSLRRFADAGLRVTYHTCDVADRDAVAMLLDRIRRQAGPIEGVLHGAGIDRSCRFEKKSRANVVATIGAKVAGAYHLMTLTDDDPVRHFIGLGSISGRLGSNGQTDYCLASDMLSKLTSWYHQRRPDCHAVTLHYHAWDEVGMAFRPQTKVARQMRGAPASMPKREGVEHLLRELYAGPSCTEVMITNWDYYLRFYPDPRPAGRAERPGATARAEAGGAPEVRRGALAQRFVLRALEDPLPTPSGSVLRLDGPAYILGRNPTAWALKQQLEALGTTVHLLPGDGDLPAAIAALESLWREAPACNLFLMTARDDDASELSSKSQWQRRRTRGILIPFGVAQHWCKLRRAAPPAGRPTLVAVTSLGGDFGFQRRPFAPEGGALAGLLKALHIEGLRSEASRLRVKVIDAPADDAPAAVAEAVCRELAAERPQIEVGWIAGRRYAVRSVRQPVEQLPRRDLTPGGTWVVTGGARGVTAAVVLELARRYGPTLHVIGKSPAPMPDAPWRDASDEQLRAIKAETVRQAVAAGRPPDDDWKVVRKDLEIAQSLRAFDQAGVRATYHSCDLADWDAVDQVLQVIRHTDGPIHAIIHGAGYARSARFEDKLPTFIDATLAKLDGAVALLALTRDDPVQYFVGFGSISGRFGGNGLTDYAAANDMLGKLAAWYRHERPACKATSFHWMSWDAVGMAVRPSSQIGAKNVLQMDFLPLAEGIEHLHEEMRAGLPESEVMIDDEHFQRTFYPDEPPVDMGPAASVSPPPPGSARRPLIDSLQARDGAGAVQAEVLFQPLADPFLREHRLKGRPFLPAVIGIEALLQAAAECAAGRCIGALTEVVIPNGLLFHSDEPVATRVTLQPVERGLAARLTSQLRDRRGRLVQADRLHVRGVVEWAHAPEPIRAAVPGQPPLGWLPYRYMDDAPIYHGPPLRGLKQCAFQHNDGWGRIVCGAPAELVGARPVAGWILPSAALDACLVACGAFVFLQLGGSVEVPHGFDRLRWARMPRVEETCTVRLTFIGREAPHSRFDFTLFGDDGQPLLQVDGYRTIQVLSHSAAAAARQSTKGREPHD